MAVGAFTKVGKSLRSLKLIVAEVGLLTVASAALMILPQVNTDPEGARRMFEGLGPFAPAIRLLQIDHILGAWWFLGLLLLSGASLGLVVWDLWKRCATQWRERLVDKSFRGAPFRKEWTRPAVGAAPSLALRTSGKASLLGLPLFHTGLLMVLLAGLLRMLCASDAVVDLHEGEILPPSPAAYGAQWPGRLGRPFALDFPLTLEKVTPTLYPNGVLKGVAAIVHPGDGQAPIQVAVNDPLQFGSNRIYLSQTFGPAAFLELREGGRRQRAVVLLRPERDGTYSDAAPVLGAELRLRGALNRDGSLYPELAIRFLREGGLRYAGSLQPGQVVALPDGGSLALVDLRYWAQFTASRDVFLPLAFAGFIVALVGVALFFLMVRVDTAVGIETCPEGERVWVALRVRRFAPLYAERFDRLVRDNGGPGEPKA